MAENAIMIDAAGQRSEKNIRELSESDIMNAFICSGTSKEGTECGVPMRPCLNTNTSKGYFYLAHRDHPHKPGCGNAHPRKKTIVEKLDRQCAGKTSQELYDFLNRDKQFRPRKPKRPLPPTDPGGSDYPGPSSVDSEDTDKKIVPKLRMPRNLEEYILLLTSLATSDQLTDKLVFDLILDERTVNCYRRFSLPAHPFVITAKKTSPYVHNIPLKNNQWLLVDYWLTGAHQYAPIVFLLNVTPEAKAKLYNLCQIDPVVKIYVYATFKKHPDIPRMYVSDTVKAHMIHAEHSA